ncbi:MAG: MFS transporter, partial [Spirochaetia bacterium]
MLTTLDPATRRLYALLLAGFVLFGVIFTVAGSALPQIIRTFGWSYTETGLVLAASSAGYLLSSFLNGFLVQRFPPRSIMLIGLGIGALSLSLFVRWPSPLLNFVLNLGIGLCQGSLEVVTNLEVIHMEQKGQSRLMNFIHASFCVGAIIGPAGVGYILREGIPLVSIFIAAAALSALLAVAAAFTRFPRVQAAPE